MKTISLLLKRFVKRLFECTREVTTKKVLYTAPFKQALSHLADRTNTCTRELQEVNESACTTLDTSQLSTVWKSRRSFGMIKLMYYVVYSYPSQIGNRLNTKVMFVTRYDNNDIFSF